MTVLGARLSIENLPKLKIFKCDYSLEVVSQMALHDNTTIASSVPSKTAANSTGQLCSIPLQLMNLWQSPFDRKTCNLSAAIHFCPFVVDVDICAVDGVFDQDLGALLDLEHLQSLSLGRMEISFDRGILPILEKFGAKSLERFSLFRLNEVDVAAVALHCPKLCSLSLGAIDRYIPSTSENRQQLINLERLHIGHSPQRTIGGPTSTDLSILLSSPSLVSIDILGINALTDQVIERMAHLHTSFTKLDSLDLFACHNVSARSIDLLLSLNVPITRLEINICNSLTSADANKWRKMALDNNWDFVNRCN